MRSLRWLTERNYHTKGGTRAGPAGAAGNVSLSAARPYGQTRGATMIVPLLFFPRASSAPGATALWPTR